MCSRRARPPASPTISRPTAPRSKRFCKVGQASWPVPRDYRELCLEVDLNCQLNDSRVGRSVNATEVSVVSSYIGIVKLRVVEDVEELAAKLHPDVFMRLERVEILA